MMKRVPGTSSAFTFVEMLVAAAVIGVLVLLVASLFQPQGCVLSPVTRSLSNARQLHLATQTMTLDTANAGGEGMQWTSVVDAHGHATPATVAQYFDALVKNDYLSENDLRKLVTAPGRGPGQAAPNAQNSCFKFFAVDGSSPADQPLMVTANWQDGQLTDAAPYGKREFVVFTKDGSGGIHTGWWGATGWWDARSTKIFPVGQDAAGHAYSHVVLK